MKTNQHMVAKFYDMDLNVEHKTMMCSLTDIFAIGNGLRHQNRERPASLNSFLVTSQTKKYIAASAAEWGFSVDDAVQVRGTGRYKGTYAHLSIAIYAAEHLSPVFHAKVIKEFVTNRLLQYRDESGDEFLSLNKIIDTLPDRVDMNNTGIYINAAKKIKERISPDGGTWNTATASQLRRRTKIEEVIIDALDNGLLPDYQTMFRLIENFKFR